MSLNDLATLKQYNIPIIIIIFDNNKLQMVHYWQKQFYKERFVNSNIINPNFVELAQSYGIESYFCDKTEQLPNIFNIIKESTNSLLIHVKIEDVDCLPFLPPNKSLNDMILK